MTELYDQVMLSRKAKMVSRPDNLYVGYVRVSTRKQGRSGLGLKAQRNAIKQHCKFARLTLSDVRVEVESAKNMNDRSVWNELLQLVEQGLITGIVCAKLDRATRDGMDWGALVKKSRAEGWKLILLDMQADLETAAGRLQAWQHVGYAQYERELIGERTSAAMQVLKAQGKRLGRPRSVPKEILLLVLTQYHACGSYGVVANLLNEHEIPTARGGKVWYRATIAKMLASQDAEKLLKKIVKQGRKSMTVEAAA